MNSDALKLCLKPVLELFGLTSEKTYGFIRIEKLSLEPTSQFGSMCESTEVESKVI